MILNNRVQIAVVGYGGMGSWHCRMIQKISELELVGIYDISEERQAVAKKII